MVGIQKGFGINPNYQTTNLNKKQKAASGPSFTGASVVEDNQGRSRHSFFLPISKNAELEIIKLENGKATSVSVDEKSSKAEGPLKIWNPDLGSVTPNAQILYKFKVNGQDYLDNTKKMFVNGSEYNVAPSLQRPNLTQPHQMYHLMPDNFNPSNKFNKDGSDIRRNHFNKYNGTLNNITDKLDYAKNLGAARIISTPVVGQDQISSHGYWTTNPYQITSTVGTINDFKNMQVELYKRGMGWISDGAFVNEGWEGVHLLDLLRYGNQSYAKNWFETFNFPDQKIKVGVLPKEKNSEAFKNFDIKIINGPIKIDQFGPEQNDEYDPKKPTQIQLYDRRLVTEDQMYNQEEIRSYAVKNLSDPNAIKTYKDSVQPLTFEVTPEEVREKFTNWENDSDENSFRDSLLQWNNFEFVSFDESGGITLWDGNKDIAKLRFTNNEKAPAKDTSIFGKLFGSNKSEKYEEINKAISQVQDYIVQVGGYWTNEVDKTLTEYTARELSKKLSPENLNLSPERKAKAIFTAIKELAQTQDPNKKGSNVLPEKVVDLINDGQLTQEHIQNLLESQYNSETGKYEGSYNLQTAPLPENILDGVMSFPLDGIEFPKEISSILSSPHIKKLATNLDEVGKKSRYELIDSPEYEQMSSTYKKLDKVYQENITPVIKEVIESSKVRNKLLDEDGELSTEGKELFRLVASDLVKYVVVKSIANMTPSKESLDKGLTLDYSDKNSPGNPYKTLHNKTYENILYLSRSSPKNAAESIVESLKDGLVRFTNDDKRQLAKYLDTRLSNIDTDLVKTSKLLVNKTESGLEWRIDAAKDIADIDSVKNKETNFENALEDITKFWNKFFTQVRKHNPKAYIIAEITDFDPLMGGKAHGRYKNPVDAETKFTEESGATTPTEYTYMFTGPSRIVHGGLEGEFGNANHFDNISDLMNTILIDGWGKNGTGTLNGLIDKVNYAHVSPGNHDKPRLLHGYALDIADFFYKNDAQAYSKAMTDSVNSTFTSLPSELNLSKDAQNTILKTIENLAHSKNKEYFARRSFVHNWEDIIKAAKEKSPEIQQLAQDTQKAQALENLVHKKFLQPAMEKYKALMNILVAMPGNPTIYAGDELGETGFETSSKNVYVQNRNRLHWEWLDKDFINDFNKDVSSIFNLRNDKKLTPLVNGHTIVLKQQKNKNNLSAIYRYNNQRDVIAVLNNKGLNNTRDAYRVAPDNLDKIDLGYNGKLGIPGGLQEGTIYKNIDSNDTHVYIVKNNSIVREDGGKIEINGPSLLLYREKPFTNSIADSYITKQNKPETLNLNV
ncbi:MAG: alpha-amylase protein [uncultured bacterium]|nr:MAG: alpha-amylase protein [uncultured bacterium]HBH17881.1 hypothetical protein [Cyanobacteria bacterium UBA9579]